MAVIIFSARGGQEPPDNITFNPGDTITLPATVPTRPGYAFAGWLPSRPEIEPYRTTPTGRGNWYKQSGVIDFDPPEYVDLIDNYCINNVFSPGTRFRRYRPGERLNISTFFRSGDTLTVWTVDLSVHFTPLFVRSVSRPDLYAYCIASPDTIVMYALWHRCTHQLVRGSDGNLLRGPDGHLLRDD